MWLILVLVAARVEKAGFGWILEGLKVQEGGCHVYPLGNREPLQSFHVMWCTRKMNQQNGLETGKIGR